MSVGGVSGASSVTQLSSVINNGGNFKVEQTLNQKAFLASLLAAQDAASKINQHSQTIKDKNASVIALRKDVALIEAEIVDLYPGGVQPKNVVYVDPTSREGVLMKQALDGAGIAPYTVWQGMSLYSSSQVASIKVALEKKIKSIKETDLPAEAEKFAKDEQVAEERVKLKEQVKKYNLILGVAAKIQKLLHDAKEKILGRT